MYLELKTLSALAGFLAVGVTVAGAVAYGRRWWPSYLLLASGVALVLLLAPDAYAAFGFLCLATVVVLAGAELRRLFTTHTERLQTRADV